MTTFECTEDEYDALARQFHESIAEGQTVEETAKALRILGGATSREAGLDAERLEKAITANGGVSTVPSRYFSSWIAQVAAEYVRLATTSPAEHTGDEGGPWTVL